MNAPFLTANLNKDMRGYFKILILLLFSYPVYLLVYNLMINGLSLLAGSEFFFYTYAVHCKVDQSLSFITYYSAVFLIKTALFLTVPLFKIHLSTNLLFRLFGLLLIVLFSFEILTFIAYAIDSHFDTYYRSFFFVSSGIHVLSLALNLPVLVIPSFFLIIAYFLIHPLLKIKKTKQILLIIVLPFFSVLLYHLLFKNIFLNN